MKRAAAALAAIVLGASGCATTPEPCTSEWVSWKTERLIADFVREHPRAFNDARNASAPLAAADRDEKGNISMMVLTAAGLVTLAADFMSDLWPEVDDALSQCATSPRAAQLFADILRDQGVDERAAQAAEQLGLLLDRRT